jgi:signal transduction histidine kinase/ActR/RegA family two-component response regulator
MMANDSPPARHPEGSGQPTATLAEVDILSELTGRQRRPPDYEREDRALAALATEMAHNPRNLLQKLVETAVDLCNADTAGISLLEGDLFRWEAVAGVFASSRHGTMPREASPCGVCIDRNATQLMHLADRCFPALRNEPRFVEALLIPFHVDGEPVGTVWIVSHSFERTFDREDERLVRNLAQFASAGWQLWKSLERAEEASHRKDEFLAMLGHELRNPLAAILNSTRVLRADASTDRARLSVDVVTRQAQDLTRMVDGLLDMSRITQGKLELQSQPLELAPVLADAVETARLQIERRRHQVSLDVPPETIWLHADRLRLTQIVANLIDNAVKYTPEPGHIWVSAARTDDRVSVTVRDTGIGIPPEQLRGIFDLFKQLDRAPEHPGAGIGLGLALVRSLAGMHGGTVEATSDGPGQGSQFTLRLPVWLGSLPADPPETPVASDVVETPRRILVVEDNDDVAQSLSMTLALDGHSVAVARDGRAALQALQAFQPDVVLLDVGLPDMNGYEVARQIRAADNGSHPTIITLSGYGQPEDRRQSDQAGCDDHLVKPVDPDALRDLFRRASSAIPSV